MLESFFGGQQTRIKRRPHELSVKRNRRLLVRLSPAVNCRAPRPEGDPAVRSEGQNVGVEESVVRRAEKQAVPGIQSLRDGRLTPPNDVRGLKGVLQRESAEGAAPSIR